MSVLSDTENAPQLPNFRDAYLRLQRKVDFALRTQLGDAERLTRTSQNVARFLSAAEEVTLPLDSAATTDFMSLYLASISTSFQLLSLRPYGTMLPQCRQRLTRVPLSRWTH
jgi:hypothetical protein